MVPPVHDDDTDYSDLDEVPANEVNHSRQSTPKTRERLSERTPLLSSSPPPPAYSDVTRGNPRYVPQTRSNHVDTNQVPDDEGAPNQQPQSMGDTLQDPEDGKKDHIRRRMAPNIQLLTFLALLLAASVTIGAIIGSRHKSSSHDVSCNTSRSPVIDPLNRIRLATAIATQYHRTMSFHTLHNVTMTISVIAIHLDSRQLAASVSLSLQQPRVI